MIVLLVHCYCFSVDPGVSLVYQADKYSLLDIVLNCTELRVVSVSIH